ncbi:MAG: chemotaxis protein CheW [Candidatus Parabeggiatoa sp.]|nr:chemotaxis protein CheW [Candidatus Parabeggiatoa sp.]
MNHSQQYCTFFVNNLFFGVEVDKVQEVIRYQTMTRVPLAPPEICGLINLRGQIVIAIDLRRRLAFEERPADHLPVNVVMRSDEGAVSFLVDDIGDVLEVDDSAFEAAPPTLLGRQRDFIRGAYKLKDKLLIALDAEKTMDFAV